MGFLSFNEVFPYLYDFRSTLIKYLIQFYNISCKFVIKIKYCYLFSKIEVKA